MNVLILFSSCVIKAWYHIHDSICHDNQLDFPVACEYKIHLSISTFVVYISPTLTVVPKGKSTSLL